MTRGPGGSQAGTDSPGILLIRAGKVLQRFAKYASSESDSLTLGIHAAAQLPNRSEMNVTPATIVTAATATRVGEERVRRQ